MSNRSRVHNDVLALTVLGLLGERPRHPYEIQRVIQERHQAWAMGKTRGLYHAVDRLLADGLIEPVETSRDGKRPERTVYRITEEGSDEYAAWLTELLTKPAPEHPLFRVAVSSLSHLPVVDALNSLKRRSIELEGQIAGVEVWLRALTVDLRLPRSVLLQVEYLLAMHQAELAWVRAIVGDIEKGKLDWDRESLRQHFESARGLAPAREGELV